MRLKERVAIVTGGGKGIGKAISLSFASEGAKVVDMNLEEWNEVLAIDLTESMLCSREVLKYMIQRKSGNIIIAAEGGRGGDGRAGYPMRSPYCCAKMGLIGLTETLAIEVGEYNIRVNAIIPATARGERLNNVVMGRAKALGVPFEELMSKITANYPLRRPAEESKIAAAVVFQEFLGLSRICC